MRVAINVAVYNEADHVSRLIESIASQTHLPDEVIFVDDGSSDNTADIITRYSKAHSFIRCIQQKNAGPAAARNHAWKCSDADVCIFTDGDCVPEKNWLEETIKCFSDDTIGAVAGTYRTENAGSILARFVGYEIAWKYDGIEGPVDFHGTYNLAVRKNVLEEIGGFNEQFKTAEDADLTYRISEKYTIYFTPKSIVGHYHPTAFWWYMKNQIQRGEDRMLLYKKHPDRMSRDVYTGRMIKYQVLAGGLLVPSLILLYPFFPMSYLVPLAIALFIFWCSSFSFPYIAKRDLPCALYGLPVQFFRSIAWFIGLVRGVIKHN